MSLLERWCRISLLIGIYREKHIFLETLSVGICRGHYWLVLTWKGKRIFFGSSWLLLGSILHLASCGIAFFGKHSPLLLHLATPTSSLSVISRDGFHRSIRQERLLHPGPRVHYGGLRRRGGVGRGRLSQTFGGDVFFFGVGVGD